MLGVAALLPFMAAVWYAFKKQTHPASKPHQTDVNQKLLIVIALFGIGASILGSALTNEGQPHSLRASAAWLFIIIFLTIGWSVLWQSHRRWMKTSAVLVFVIGALAYAVDLAFLYPARAAESFDASARAQIQQGQLPAGYPELSLDYYRTK
jgi:uncharacterized membrane protein YedE/YeeE